MGSKFFDIPFRSISSDSDFACKDGEVNQGGAITGSSAEYDITPDVDFALVREILPGWHIHPDVYPAKTVLASDPSMEYWTSMAARLLELFNSEAEQHNLFVAPFYAMAVWRTSNSSYLSPGHPVLLIPNSEPPAVATDSEIDRKELEMKIAGAICSLRFKMKAPEALRDYVGKISSLEILISSPLHKYDTFHSFIPQHRLSTDAWCESLDPETGIIAKRKICTETLALGWKAALRNMTTDTWLPFASIPLKEVDLLEDWITPSEHPEWVCDIFERQGIKYHEIEKTGSSTGKSELITIEGSGEEIDVETRPLKLSGAGAWKMAKRVFLRGRYTPSCLTISVYGSRNMIEWWCIAKKKGGTVVGLPRSPFRFYKVRIQGLLEEGENLQGLSVII